MYVFVSFIVLPLGEILYAHTLHLDQLGALYGKVLGLKPYIGILLFLSKSTKLRSDPKLNLGLSRTFRDSWQLNIR